MEFEGDRVGQEGEAQQVDQDPVLADRVGSTQPHAVVQRPVDGLGVVAPAVEPLVVGVRRYSGSAIAAQ